MIIFKEIIDFISKPFSKAPGWAPLWLVAVWFTNSEYSKQLSIERFGVENPEISETFLALILTLVFFKIGDWLDEIVFNKRVIAQSTKSVPADPKRIRCHRFDPKIVRQEREAARKALGIEGGSYRVATALLKATGKMNGVTIANEAAKFLRSLVVPFTIAAIFGLFVNSNGGRFWLLGSAFFSLLLYILLKLFHIWLLYHRAKVIPKDEKFEKEIRKEGYVFWWDGITVTSADPNKSDPCRQ